MTRLAHASHTGEGVSRFRRGQSAHRQTPSRFIVDGYAIFRQPAILTQTGSQRFPAFEGSSTQAGRERRILPKWTACSHTAIRQRSNNETGKASAISADCGQSRTESRLGRSGDQVSSCHARETTGTRTTAAFVGWPECRWSEPFKTFRPGVLQTERSTCEDLSYWWHSPLSCWPATTAMRRTGGCRPELHRRTVHQRAVGMLPIMGTHNPGRWPA